MSALSARKRFATMDGCPVEGCTAPLIITKGRKPTVVGVKRHVRHWHPEAFDKVQWPVIHAEPSGRKVAEALRAPAKAPAKKAPAKKAPAKKAAVKKSAAKKAPARKPRSVDLGSKSIDELRKQARAKGINPIGLTKVRLIEALS